MSKRVFLFSFILCLPGFISAQVGINTEKPQTSLDVNGDVQLRGELRVGTSPDDEIATGTAGQVLTSQGPSNPPKWTNFSLQKVFTGYYTLADTKMLDDKEGLKLEKNIDYTSPINYGDNLNSEWQILEGLSSDLTIEKDSNEVIYTFQCVIQSPYAKITEVPSSNFINIVCGIFIGKKTEDRSTYKLMVIRQGIIQGNHYPQLTFTLMASSENIPSGEYEVVFAFQRRGGSKSLTELDLYVGKGFNSTPYNVSNLFMNKPEARIDVFEPNDN